MADAGKKVQQIINDNNVVVFSKSYCPHCRATKQLLTSLGADYTTLELDNLSDGAALQDALEELNGQRSVPNIYIEKKHVGGNSELQQLKSFDKLEDMLKHSGALKA